MDGTTSSHGSRQTVALSRRRDKRSHPASTELAEAAEGLIHAVRNPLFALRLDLHTLRQQIRKAATPTESDWNAEAASILSNCERQLECAEQYLADFAAYACSAPAVPETLNLHDELQKALEQVGGPIASVAVTVASRDADDELLVFIDPAQLRQILSALLEVAASAPSPDKTLVKMRTRNLDAIISITNPQWTLSPRDCRRLLQPFARIENCTPTARLAAAKRFAVQAGGRLTCRSGIEKGATLRLRLPLSDERL